MAPTRTRIQAKRSLRTTPGKQISLPPVADGGGYVPAGSTDRASSADRDAPGVGQRGRIAALVLVPLAAGIVTAMAGTFVFRGTALFLVNLAPEDPAALAPYRAELIEHAWGNVPTVETQPSFRWDVVADADEGSVRLELLADDYRVGQRTLRQVAESYLAHLQTMADRALNQPSVGETIVRQRLEHLRSGLSATARREQHHAQAMPAENLVARRDQTSQDLHQRRDSYRAERDQFRGAQAELARLEATPVPEHPPIDPDLRARAVWEAIPLTQDLAELKVRLATARSRMLTVWQDSTPHLDELVAATGELQRTLSADLADNITGSMTAVIEQAREAVDELRTVQRAFARSWTQELTALSREGTVDPNSTSILEAQERLAGSLGDFLYQASSSLAVIREQERNLMAASDSQARHHVLAAKLTRGFHAVASAHHRFEFAASEIQTANNFRLAAAVRSARGLRRRTLFLQQELTQHLEQVTGQQLESARQERIAQLQEEIARLTGVTDAGLDGLLQRQDEYDAVAAQMEAYVAGRATATAISERVAEYNSEISNTQAQLDKLAAQRHCPVDPQAIRLVSCQMKAIPSNLIRRLAYGWAAAATAFLALLGFQHLGRNRQRP